ncbi:hypothetical protein JCM10450v2_006524 [Rhodotorula kratochvilovae]
MHDADTLLGCLDAIYDWLLIGSQSSRSNTPRGRIKGIAHMLRDSATAFRLNWGAFLPSERERIIDNLLSAFCTMCTSLDFDVQSVVYVNLCEAVGASGLLARRGSQAHEAAYARVRAAVEHIIGLYQRVSAASIHKQSQAEEAAHWAGTFLGPAGLTGLKALRMDLRGLDALAISLEQRRDALQRTETGGFPLPFPRDVLPDAQHSIANAEIVAQSADDRMAALRRLLGYFVELYSPANHARLASSTSFHDSAQSGTMVDAAETLSRGTSLQHFAALSLMQQHGVVKNARSALYAVCEELRQQRMLPDAATVAHGLFQPILNPDLREEPGEGTQARPLVLESLAHTANALRQISDRKAQRYYGTSASAWQARSAAGGL